MYNNLKILITYRKSQEEFLTICLEEKLLRNKIQLEYLLKKISNVI